MGPGERRRYGTRTERSRGVGRSYEETLAISVAGARTVRSTEANGERRARAPEAGAVRPSSGEDDGGAARKTRSSLSGAGGTGGVSIAGHAARPRAISGKMAGTVRTSTTRGIT